MEFEAATAWLYAQTPQFERIGAAAYKPGLQTVIRLAEAFNNPHHKYKIIHVAGTNGKGSTSHTLAAVLQQAGYRVGLYTSPHLVDFRERMRIDGRMIPREAVGDFVERYLAMNLGLEPSFFELTTIMAFEWFARENVDVAIIEVGLGGRLDSTNIISPELDVITNISKDHCAQLGDTLREIAHEKAGIMRESIACICGEPSEEIRGYLAEEARAHHTPLRFAQEEIPQASFRHIGNELIIGHTPFGTLNYQLTAEYQHENALTVMAAILQLRRQGWNIPDNAVKSGFAGVCTLTGLAGRWMKLADSPLTIADTGHNIGGWLHLAPLIAALPKPLTVVLGFADDKDTLDILRLLPADADYIATQADIPRARNAEKLACQLREAGLKARPVAGVKRAFDEARAQTPAEGAVFVGGSTYVIADLLKLL